MTGPLDRTGANVSRNAAGGSFGAANARLAKAFNQRAGDEIRADQFTVKLHRVSGFVTVADPGEVAHNVYFPVWFIETPGMSFGAELADGHSPLEQHFPTVSVVVLRWIKKTRANRDYFIGANLGVVTTGREGHQMIVHWHAEAKGMVNPLGGTGTVDGTI